MKCTGIGYFACEPKLHVNNNTKFCEFSLAIKERRRREGKTNEITNYFTFRVWAEAAELISKYKKKGDAIYFEAVPRDDDKNGYVYFRITDFQFLNLKKKRDTENIDTK